MSIRFAEPPRARRSGWEKEAAKLRANPGKWAHFEDFDQKTLSSRYGFVRAVREGILKSFRDGTYEATVIKGQVWARFVGDKS